MKTDNSIEEKRTVLVIDDEESIRKFMTIHLQKEGYQVIQSSGGKEVFKVIENNIYEVIFSDIRMPGVSGIQILEFVKENFDNMPVIMLTGVMEIETAVEIMRKGAFDYLIKPVKKENLIRTLRKALDRKDLVERNKQLEQENRDYQLYLEDKVKDRTRELNEKNVELKSAYADLKSVSMEVVNVLAQTIEAKDSYTHGHCARLRTQALRLAKLVSLSEEEETILEYASVLHDLGKIKIREAVLNKKERLDEEEYEHIKEHSEFGERILKKLTLLAPVAKIVGAHHEYFDGSGYPNGLKGTAIPVASRIITLVDTFDAMISDRPYRTGLPLEKVLDEIRRVSGSQLDPNLVKIFMDHQLYISVDNGR